MIDFKSDIKGVWFYFDEDNHDLASVCLRKSTFSDYDEIRRLTVRPGKTDYHRGARYETEKTNEQLQRKLSFRKAIVDWKGISLKGKILDCTDDNKDKMMEVPDFRDFVGDCIVELSESNKTLEAARLKNSETLLDGDLESQETSAETSA